MDATKRPWKVFDGGKLIGTDDDVCEHVCHLHWEGIPYVNAKADAELIVRAVNRDATFDQAREALDGLLSVLATYRKTTGVMDGGALKGWEQKGREALAAMEATHE